MNIGSHKPYNKKTTPIATNPNTPLPSIPCVQDTARGFAPDLDDVVDAAGAAEEVENDEDEDEDDEKDETIVVPEDDTDGEGFELEEDEVADVSGELVGAATAELEAEI